MPFRNGVQVSRVVLVCGGRTFDDQSLLKRTLDDLLLTDGIICVVHGAARGADTQADKWAEEAGIERRRYPITRRLQEDGFMRNARMLNREAIDLVVAFPGGNGTADMVRRARQRGIHVIEVL